MLRPAQLFRLVHINWVLVRHGLDEIIFATHLLRPLRLVFALAPWRWWRTPERRAPRGERIRRALEDLLPGQMVRVERKAKVFSNGVLTRSGGIPSRRARSQ